MTGLCFLTTQSCQKFLQASRRTAYICCSGGLQRPVSTCSGCRINSPQKTRTIAESLMSICRHHLHRETMQIQVEPISYVYWGKFLVAYRLCFCFDLFAYLVAQVVQQQQPRHQLEQQLPQLLSEDSTSRSSCKALLHSRLLPLPALP
jgi:hypothetical protein